MIDPLSLLYDILTAAIIVVLIWLGSEGLIRAFTASVEKSGAKTVPIRRISEGIRLCATIVAIALIFDFTGIGGEEIPGLTLSAIIALVASLALQTTLSNVLSGFMLFHDGFVHEGDSIEVGGVKGKVMRITLRTSYIKTDDENYIAISNQRMLQGPLTNFSRKQELLKKVSESNQ